MSTPKLFVWRGTLTIAETVSPMGEAHDKVAERVWKKWGELYREYWKSCPFCSGVYDYRREDEGGIFANYTIYNTCQRCGFYHLAHVGQGIQDYWTSKGVAALLELDINDSELGLNELCTHLQRQYEDIYSLSPYRFEKIVEDIFRRNYGYRTRRTQSSRDGGYDIVLLEESTGKKIIVECKRYAKNRRVGVGIIRQLLGVELINNFSEAKLVSSSYFTEPAKAEAESKHVALRGFRLDLIDADALLRELQTYNEKLPPLYKIDLKKFGQ